MKDFDFWWYIIAAIVYFISRSRKKKRSKNTTRPGTENRPSSNRPSKSFEELLKEITEGGLETEDSKPIEQESIEIDQKEERPEWRPIEEKNTEQKRFFADAESRKVYEDSIKMAEGADLAFDRDDHFKKSSILGVDTNDASKSYAEELMDGFDVDEAKKAVVYSEIFNRKY